MIYIRSVYSGVEVGATVWRFVPPARVAYLVFNDAPSGGELSPAIGTHGVLAFIIGKATQIDAEIVCRSRPMRAPATNLSD